MAANTPIQADELNEQELAAVIGGSSRLEQVIADTFAINAGSGGPSTSDVDMAQAMMSFTRNNILSQAELALRDHVKGIPQGVMQLLR